MIKEYPIDTNRIYVIGMSMGGYGTFDLVGAYPERLAAAIAMCGGGQVAMAENLAQVPLWVIHGAADRVVPPSQSRKMVTAIQAAESNVCYYTEIPRLGHGALTESYGHPQLYDWLFRHVKDRSLTSTAAEPPTYSARDFTWRVVDKKKHSKGKKKKRKTGKKSI